jgi:hypothetical protein
LGRELVRRVPKACHETFASIITVSWLVMEPNLLLIWDGSRQRARAQSDEQDDEAGGADVHTLKGSK